MARIERFEDLEAWQLSRELTRMIYRLTADGKFARDFGLRDQIRRAAVAIMSNIAEGFERSGDKEFLQFLAMAKGSCGEVRSQLYVASDQQYFKSVDHDAAVFQVKRVASAISGLMRYLRQSELRGSKFR